MTYAHAMGLNAEVSHIASRTVYYLPGYGGQLATGLGQGLLSRGFEVAGRETRGEFRDLPFQDQIETIVSDLQAHFWHRDTRVVCNSFGAYLFLHAQAQMQPFIGRVLLLAPIVGEFTNDLTRTSFSPPRPTKLRELAMSGAFNTPRRCEIHVGQEDWQSIPANVQAFGQALGIPVTVVPGGGHDLGKEYVSPLLDKWLPG